MKVFIISFGPNPRIVARPIGSELSEKIAEKKINFWPPGKPYTQRRCYATLRGRGRRQ